jgi:hypothetical protein
MGGAARNPLRCAEAGQRDKAPFETRGEGFEQQRPGDVADFGAEAKLAQPTGGEDRLNVGGGDLRAPARAGRLWRAARRKMAQQPDDLVQLAGCGGERPRSPDLRLSPGKLLADDPTPTNVDEETSISAILCRLIRVFT